MFKRLAPQKVQHTSGYIVQTGGRYSLEYIGDKVTASVEADFVRVTGIYPESMTIRDLNASTRPATEEERARIMERITSALAFLGEKYEIYRR